MKLDKMVAIVTGASSGMGAVIAEYFAKEGATVCMVAGRNSDAANNLSASINETLGRGATYACQANVTDQESITSMVQTCIDKHGRVDILVNCAGVYEVKSVLEHTEAIWDKTFSVNVKGNFLCSKAVIPHMIKQRFGKIINFGSIFGAYGVPDALAYGASKMAIHGMTKMLAIELGPHQINVNAIAPGNIVTPINIPLYQSYSESGDIEEGKKNLAKKHYPLGRLGDTSDIAHMAVYLASKDSNFVTGQIYFVDGGYTAQ